MPSGCRSASPRFSGARPPRGCARSTTRSIGPSGWRSSPSATSIRSSSKPRSARRSGRSRRGPPPHPPDRSVPLHKDLLISIVTDPEVTQSSVQLIRRRTAESDRLVGDYRRSLVEQPVRADAQRSFRRDGAASPTRSSWAPASAADRSADGRHLLAERPRAGRRPRRRAGGARDRGEAGPASSASRRGARSREAMDASLSTSAPTTSATRNESGSFAQEYVRYFLRGTAARNRLRVPARAAGAAGHHTRRGDRARPRAAGRREPRRPRDVAAEGGI